MAQQKNYSHISTRPSTACVKTTSSETHLSDPDFTHSHDFTANDGNGHDSPFHQHDNG